MKRRLFILVPVLLCCLLLTACKEVVEYLPIDQFSAPDKLYWISDEFGEDTENTSDDVHRTLSCYDLQSHALSSMPLGEFSPEILLRNDHPSGFVLIDDPEGNHEYVLYAPDAQGQLTKYREFSLPNCSRILAMYDDIVYYADGGGYIFSRALATGEEHRYPDETRFCEWISPEGKVFKIWPAWRYYEGKAGTCDADVGKARFGCGVYTRDGGERMDFEVSGGVFEDCCAACWIDEETVLLHVLLRQSDGKYRETLYLYSVEDHSFEHARSATGEGLFLEKGYCTGSSHLAYDSMAVDPEGKYVVYTLNKGNLLNLDFGAADMVLLSLEDGERYLVCPFSINDGRYRCPDKPLK